MSFEILRMMAQDYADRHNEMYECIQEVIVKGMTDVHAIQRYARQKKISLYGA